MDNRNRKTVSILGKEYQVSCSPEEAEGLDMAAAYLDKMMREVRGRVVGLERIAIMAALNISYQLIQQSGHTEPNGSGLEHYEQRIKALQHKIDAAMATLAPLASHKPKFVAEAEIFE
ncbi:MAG: cell division protein ZapA [Pseudomonadota bacterium]